MKIQTRRFELAGDYAGFWIKFRWDDDAEKRFKKQFQKQQSHDLTVRDRRTESGAALQKSVAQSLALLHEWFAVLASITVASNLTDDDDQPVNLTTREGWQEMPEDFVREIRHAVSRDWKRWRRR
ncbi:MAG: hypothetical protein M3O91_04095 [Chloroflexota bacterium]|nr:hypothetical protein [Chloroflexota bacterium]